MVRRIWVIAAIMILALAPWVHGADERGATEVLLDDGFDALKSGLFSSVLGAHAEYHYLPEVAPKGNWVVSAFASDVGSERAWKVQRENGDALLVQTYRNKAVHTHPIVIAGDALWADCSVSVRFAPDADQGQSGFVFRYRNDRCYYFFGVDGPKAILKKVRHETAFHKPDETILAQKDWSGKPGQFLTAEVSVQANRIRAQLDDGTVLEATDSTYPSGRIGLMADAPTRYSHVKVTCSAAEKQRVEAARRTLERESAALQAANPRPVLWKKIRTENFGVGRNLRFGDLDADGRVDVLIGQVVHHGPKDRYSELSCLTAMTFEGKRLWQIGTPDGWKDHLTNDVAFQIIDLDGDGRNEVVYCMKFEIIVADGATGKTKYKAPTPASKGDYGYPRILGDCLYFCDLRGTGRPRDLIIKDRYKNLWALDDRLQPLWEASCNTGHYPFACDVDGDKKDELLIGYTLFDDDGKPLWSLDDRIKDHADGVAIVRFGATANSEPRVLCAASDEGIFFTDLKGNVLKHLRLGHVQNPATANFRDDLPGLETVSINFWGNQGIIHFFNAEGDVYHDFEPVQHGSMCLPINWTGRSEEFFVLSPNVEEGGMFDGRGRKAVAFPADGHPDMCNAVLDIMGDCRDEVVVWDPYELWVYTQSDNPKTGKLYKPVRNSLSNYSNYQATVSLPGWSE
jgi:hypothetical protein